MPRSRIVAPTPHFRGSGSILGGSQEGGLDDSSGKTQTVDAD